MRNISILQEDGHDFGCFHHELLEPIISGKDLVLVRFFSIYIHVFLVPVILGAVELLLIEHHILLYGENQ